MEVALFTVLSIVVEKGLETGQDENAGNPLSSWDPGKGGAGQVESRVWERMDEKGIEVDGKAKERNGGCDLSPGSDV